MKVKRCEECDLEECKDFLILSRYQRRPHGNLHRCKVCRTLFLDPVEVVEEVVEFPVRVHCCARHNCYANINEGDYEEQGFSTKWTRQRDEHTFQYWCPEHSKKESHDV